MPATMERSVAQAGARVLVVDDDARSRKCRRDLLTYHGYEVTEAIDGEAALACVAAEDPHVILLDVMMPGLDGFEVCRRLKADPRTAPIPVLLITSLGAREDRLKGIAAGATDFLTKPVDPEDVILRVRNAVQVKRLYDQEQQALTRLRQLEGLRDTLVHLTVHDMRSPLTSMCINLEYMLHDDVRSRLRPEEIESLNVALYSTRELVEMVTAILDVSRLDAGKMPLRRQMVDLGRIAGEAAALLGGMADLSPIDVECPEERLSVWCDGDIIRRVFTNLLGNALKYSPARQAVTMHLGREGDNVRVTVTDLGPGIPAEYHRQIFEKFGRAETVEQNRRRFPSSGLGLTFCRLAVEAHGGTIGVISEQDKGSTFWFVLPVKGEVADVQEQAQAKQ